MRHRYWFLYKFTFYHHLICILPPSGSQPGKIKGFMNTWVTDATKVNLMRHARRSYPATFTQQCGFSFSITVSPEPIALSEMEECWEAYMRRTGAKNSGEDRIPVEQVFHQGPAFRSPSPRAYICTVLLRSTVFAYEYDTRAQIFRVRQILNVRFIRFKRFSCVKIRFSPPLH